MRYLLEAVIAGLRLAAILWRLELPAVQLPEDDAG